MRRKKSERLLDRLRDELGLDIPTDATIERTYAGHWQKLAGAFVWTVVKEPAYPVIGSGYTVTKLLKRKLLHVTNYWGDLEVWPTGEMADAD